MNFSKIIPAFILFLGAGFVGAAAWSLFHRHFPSPGPPSESAGGTLSIYKFDSAMCPAGSHRMKNKDPYMRGILDEGSDFTAQMNWYSCHPIARGDLVLYRFSHKREPVVKRVVASPGDRIAVAPDGEGRGWTLEVNGEKILGHNQKPYIFGGPQPPPLKLYQETHNGTLNSQDAVLFSSFSPGDSDSGVFGAISLTDIVGFVEPDKISR